MSNGHTPGPWELIGDTVMADPRRHLPDTMLGIANIQDHGSDRPLAVHKANARLLVAAPDLLKACEALVAYDDMIEEDDGKLMMHYADLVRLSRAAIAKAKGQPC